MQIKINIDKQDATLLSVWFQDISANIIISQVPNRRWSNSRKCWLVPNTRDTVVLIGKLFGKQNCIFSNEVVEIYSPKNLENYQKEQTKRQWKNTPTYSELYKHPLILALHQRMTIKNYAFKTIKNYRSEVIRMIHFFAPLELKEVRQEDFEKYLAFLVEKKKLASASLNVTINAFKFVRENLLELPSHKLYKLPVILRNKQLAVVMSKEQVLELINKTTSLKYKTIFSLIYSAGLRIGETTRLKITDINKDDHTIYINKGKGKRDRYVMLSEKILVLLREYYQKYRPKEYLFENDFNQEHLSERSIQEVFKTVVRSMKIDQRVSVHTLRHSFATHLLEGGTDISKIQKILGHSDPKTTMIYLHMGKNASKDVRSPFDDLDFNL